MKGMHHAQFENFDSGAALPPPPCGNATVRFSQAPDPGGRPAVAQHVSFIEGGVGDGISTCA